MFPTVRVSFSGPLRFSQPADRYAILMDIVPTDARRYRYAYHRSAWLVAGNNIILSHFLWLNKIIV